jgi:D-glycero-alpha-D-manno-heptose-7-phosphate kinase
MSLDLYELLTKAEENKKLPTVIAYNRIDGPGSSLDLREFQQSFWTLPNISKDISSDISMQWTRYLPRTIGITIDTGTKIEARPLDSGLIGVNSIEYKTEVISRPGEVLPTKENWLLKIVEIFGLKGVKFVLQNLRAGTRSAGLGGSATAATGVCILANELAGRPFSKYQLIAFASRIEQDMGVSITGTQEQSNTIFGGITDYLWFPWGIPGQEESGYGMSIQSELIQPCNYDELEKRMVIFHSGIEHASSDVNSVWREALMNSEGYNLHKSKLEIAYLFREGLRLKKWDQVLSTITKYRKIRTKLCEEYMDGAREILGHALNHNSEAFPLGAGAGGGILVFSPFPDSITKLKEIFKGVYREIPIKIKSKGHELINIPKIGGNYGK